MPNPDLTQQALALPLTEQVELAQALWQSISDRSFAAEDDRDALRVARRRNEDLTAGRVTGRSHEQVMGLDR